MIITNRNINSGYKISLFNFEVINIPFSSFFKIIWPINFYLKKFDLINLEYYIKNYDIDKNKIESIVKELEKFVLFKYNFFINHLYEFLYFYMFIIVILYFFLMIRLNKENFAFFGIFLGIGFYFLYLIIKNIIYFYYIKNLRKSIVSANKYLKNVNNNLDNIKIKIGKNFSYIIVILLFNVNKHIEIKESKEYIDCNNINYYKIDVLDKENIIKI